MSYEKVTQAKRYIIGTKQSVKALKTGEVAELVVASDADLRIVAGALMAAKEAGTAISYADSMEKLGKACGINVGAATVAILK
ncbi:50S ribosomal protein L7ae-like protein [Mesobacillus zeae]|uniref:50S ribosomal protein L7ae-like protein n=1 Tax=Mesobacillus zeae TaxID=1917180 RepID=A0A398B8Z1_9BACI|nr:50S ribosomal protein L7ae-like protein [Mesobacillus zeae]RID85961.1 50S ribosomal protein L7ae-like protein [Mesobacillus zeae]